MLVKVYLDEFANVGDTVVAFSNPFNRGDWKVDYEYEVVQLGHGYILVTSDRLPSYKKEITISDNYYKVVKYVSEKDVPKFSKIYNLIPLVFPIGLSILLILFI